MKVKIRVDGKDIIYDAEEVPIMIVMSDADKKNIGNMTSEARKYLCWPRGKERWSKTPQEIRDWMRAL